MKPVSSFPKLADIPKDCEGSAGLYRHNQRNEITPRVLKNDDPLHVKANSFLRESAGVARYGGHGHGSRSANR